MSKDRIYPLAYRSDTKEGYEVTCGEIIYNASDDSLTKIDVPSPFDFVGEGRTYGQALEDYIQKFIEYLDKLNRFYTDILLTQRAYTDAVDVDYNWNPLKEQGYMLMYGFREQYKKEYKDEQEE